MPARTAGEPANWRTGEVEHREWGPLCLRCPQLAGSPVRQFAGFLPEFFHMRGEHVAQPREPWMGFEVLANVAQCSGNVLDVYGVAARGRLVAEGAEGLQVPLQRHQVEPVAKGLFLPAHTF